MLCLARVSNLENFQVVLDNPSNIFFTGQRVEGRVSVPIIITTIVIKLFIIVIIPLFLIILITLV